MNPQNLTRKGNTYYARFKIPVTLRALISRSEFKLSLQTSCYKTACRRILSLKILILGFFRMAATLDALSLTPHEKEIVTANLRHYVSTEIAAFRHIESADTEQYNRLNDEFLLLQDRRASLINALRTDDFSETSVIDFALRFGAMLPEHLQKQLLSTNPLWENPDFQFLARRSCEAGLSLGRQMQLAERQVEPLPISIPQGAKRPARTNANSPKLSEVIDQYLDEHKENGTVNKTINEYRTCLYRMVDALNNPYIGDIKRSSIKQFRSDLNKFPADGNRAKVPFSLTITLEHDRTLSRTSVNKHMNRASSLFAWAIREELGISKNPAEGLEQANTKQPHELRNKFSCEQIKALFALPAFAGAKTFNQTAHYWAPLIALYSGARIEEISQLHTADIQEIDGIWAISINSEEEKGLKTSSSNRTVPIHSKLIELGLVQYRLHLKKVGHKRLFPTLTRNADNGYSHSVGRWFTQQKQSLGFKDNVESFHSFRHTVADELKQKGVEEAIIAAIIGHAHGGITHNRYGKKYTVAILKPYVEKLDFNIDALPFNKVRLKPIERKCLDSVDITAIHAARKLRSKSTQAPL